jgi:hypothetical protein
VHQDQIYFAATSDIRPNFKTYRYAIHGDNVGSNHYPNFVEIKL